MDGFRLGVMSLAVACLTGSFMAQGWAQSYPAKTIHYVVPSSAGGGSDYLSRIVTEELTQTFGQQVVVENRAGAASNIGAEFVAKAPADGYTVLQVSQSLAVNASLYRNLPYNLVRDFAPITLMVLQPYIVVVHSSLPVKSIGELVSLAKAKPGEIHYPSAGTGSASFFAQELFKNMAGVNLVHVPYKGGGPALISVIAGETSAYFAPIPPAMPHIQQGRLRALAVTTAKRLPTLPEYPTVAEGGVTGYEATQWYGLAVPVKAPKEAIATLHRATVDLLAKPGVSKRLNEGGYVTVGNQPGEYAAFLKAEIATLAKLIQQTGVTAE
jgi:tripartite-type tricarboxylate transporter receptor subunit TctC